MRFERRYTTAGQSPYAGIPFRKALSEIRNPDGSVRLSGSLQDINFIKAAEEALRAGRDRARDGATEGGGPAHSHSMVPGGLEVTSSTTRLTSRTSLVMRVEIRASTSDGTRVQSAVMASSEVTGRSTTGWP